MYSINPDPDPTKKIIYCVLKGDEALFSKTFYKTVIDPITNNEVKVPFNLADFISYIKENYQKTSEIQKQTPSLIDQYKMYGIDKSISQLSSEILRYEIPFSVFNIKNKNVVFEPNMDELEYNIHEPSSLKQFYILSD
jgi:hypothetical protein